MPKKQQKVETEVAAVPEKKVAKPTAPKAKATTKVVAEKPKAEPVVEKKKGKKTTSDDETAPSKGGKWYKIDIPSITPPLEDTEKLGKSGRFAGKSPMQAASKVFTKIRRVSGLEAFECDFAIVECTRGCKNPQPRWYHGTCILLPKPEVIERNGVKITHRFKSKVRSLKKSSSESDKSSKSSKSDTQTSGTSKSKKAEPKKSSKKQEETEDEEDEQQDSEPEEDASSSDEELASEEEEKPVPKKKSKK